jgi:predicted AlkP superfamily phosphohydrolase/phosphomutase
MVIGLDCASPALVFDRFRDSMPRVSRLMEEGSWGSLRSCVPPITVPAWACMLSGRDPGQLGLYGLRDRRPGSYELDLVDSGRLRRPLVWDLLGEAGKRVAVLFVPPSYPPFEVAGCLVSCFLTPDARSPHTYPARLQGDLGRRFGPYLPDVENFRQSELGGLPGALERMAVQHFDLA